jgi:uncharacterized membrane protein YhaH (DUF805 family)
MAETRWHVAIDGVQHGPLTADEIRARGVLPDHALVWTDGMAEWQPVGATPLAGQLAAAASAPPPPGLPQGGMMQPGMAQPGMAYPGPATMDGAAPTNVGFVDAIRICLTKYIDFNGRAGRPEFWWFMLAGFILSLLTGWINYVGPLVSLALLLPNIAVGVRRLHDTDRSGWWYLIAFVPLIGIIVLIVFWAQGGTEGRNRFG